MYSPGKADEGDAALRRLKRVRRPHRMAETHCTWVLSGAHGTRQKLPRVGLRAGSIGVTGLVGQLHYKEDIAEHFGIFPIDIYLQLRFFDLGYGIRVACVFRP